MLRAYYAGVDLGGTKTAVAIGDGHSTTLVANRTIETQGERGPDDVLARIAATIDTLRRDAGVSIEAICMGVPGLCDIEQGRVLFCPNLTGYWRGIEAAAILNAATGAPVRLLNDARAAAFGEFRFGDRPGSDLIMVTVGTGIGGGVVLDGRLRLGRFGAAGEIGHQTIVPNGVPCGCGNHGCVESVASGPALTAEGVRLLRIGLAPHLHELVSGDAGAVTPTRMAQAADAGDREIEAAITRAARWLGVGIANAVTLLGVERVVLTGGMSALGERLLAPIRTEIQHRVRMFPPSDVTVARSTIGEGAGLLGAIAWAATTEVKEKTTWTTTTQT
ncbi:MAG: ROK family protein [Bryobacteraceae bacterium]|nr:ROK family protein [Bryobacteraceae bacterium]